MNNIMAIRPRELVRRLAKQSFHYSRQFFYAVCKPFLFINYKDNKTINNATSNLGFVENI
jgi:hypothetical protein